MLRDKSGYWENTVIDVTIISIKGEGMSRIKRTKKILWPLWVIPLFWVFFFSPSAFAIPMIKVTYPNGGEIWEIGSTQVIQWAHSGWPGAYVKIELIRGYGVNRVISSKTYVGDKGVGFYKWTVPSYQMLGNNFKIRVTSVDNSRYTDISDNYFTIAQAASASLQVKIPNGGEIWKAGSSQTIRWTYSGKVPATVKIELLRGSTVAGLIASGVGIGEGGQGFYPWNLPSAMVAGKDYKIRVTAETSMVNIGDTSDNYFVVEGQSSLCQAQVPDDRWKGEYFNNMTLGGTSVMIRDDGTGFLNFDWAGGSPSTSCGVTPDNFSSRWTRTVNFPAGSYLFTIIADDGVRFWIDGKLLLDKWIDQSPTKYDVGPIALSGGNHTLKMEFYEKGGGATAKLSWQTASNPCQAKVTADHWMGEYFSNRDLAGTPVMVRDDGTGFLNFDWLEGSPNPSCGVPADQFSVRWTREVFLSEGKYRFTVTADDGVRLWLNGKLLLDKWIDQAPTTYTVGPLPLYEGAYTIKMEYYEMGGGATAKLSWEKEPPFALEWPNEISKANSDPWLAEHHREIKVMRPKVLALNFVNHRTMEEMKGHLQKTIQAIAESSRYHGYKNPSAPAFLQYDLAYAIDLRDKTVPPGYPYRNSTRYPRENPKEGYWGFDYEKLFTPEFAVHFGIPDPDQPTRFLTLCELIDRGLVHEVWIYGDGDVPDVSAAEVLELKPPYDQNRNRIPGQMSRCAGNGCFDSEDDIPCTRMVRIAYFNNMRGVGCFLESLSHGMESMGRDRSLIPYLAPYFINFAGFDLNTRYGLPFDTWYACHNEPEKPGDPPPPCLVYPTESSVRYDLRNLGRTGIVDPYDPICGNVHFAPNGRSHYDLESPYPVRTSCGHFRDGSGQTDLFTTAAFAPYESLASDCDGPFLVWWRQNMPGLDNLAKDDQGQSMLNWWPFLFY